MALIGWNTLPSEILLDIFSRLKERDLVNASSTCRHWRRVYHTPRLWACRTFTFNGIRRGPAPQVAAPHVAAPQGPAPQVAALQVPAPQVPVQQVPVPQVAALQVPASQVPAPQVAALQVPALQVPAEQVAALQVPAPQVPAPQVPAPQVAALQDPQVLEEVNMAQLYLKTQGLTLDKVVTKMAALKIFIREQCSQFIGLQSYIGLICWSLISFASSVEVFESNLWRKSHFDYEVVEEDNPRATGGTRSRWQKWWRAPRDLWENRSRARALGKQVTVSHSRHMQMLEAYIQSLGPYLQHVRISCDKQESTVLVESSIDAVKFLLAGLSRLPGGHVTIKSFEFNFSLHKQSTKIKSHWRELGDCLSTFLESQENLQQVVMRSDFMPFDLIDRVITGLASGQFFKRLELLDIHSFCSKSHVTGQLKCPQSARFCKLRELSVEYVYLKASRLVPVCQALGSSLRHLVVHSTPVDCYVDTARNINSATWRQACQLCPGLQVTFNCIFLEVTTSLLVADMPLVEISSLDTLALSERHDEADAGTRAAFLLDHLANTFPETLRTAFLLVSRPRPLTQSLIPLKTLVKFLSQCHQVQQLVFSSQLMTHPLMSSAKCQIQTRPSACRHIKTLIL